MLSPGTVLSGRYSLLRPIGSGGFGAVYAARHVVTERQVAVKTLWPHFACDPASRERFLRESRLAAQTESEYIVGVFDAGVDETIDTPFLVMELLEGENLNARLRRKRRFSREETLVYLAQTAAALERTHARGIVHCDLKPANLFLTRRQDGAPLVKVLDFGIAKLLSAGAMDVTHSLGTPLYMAPEQLMRGSVTPAVDVYALGQIAFRFLVGESYYRLEQQSLDAVSLGVRLVGGPSERASERARAYGTSLPEAFDEWFARAAHARADRRFSSAKEAVLGLASALELPAPEPLLIQKPQRFIGALTFTEPPQPAGPPCSTLAPTMTQTRTELARVPGPKPSHALLYAALLASSLLGAVASTSLAWARQQTPRSAVALRAAIGTAARVPTRPAVIAQVQSVESPSVPTATDRQKNNPTPRPEVRRAEKPKPRGAESVREVESLEPPQKLEIWSRD